MARLAEEERLRQEEEERLRREAEKAEAAVAAAKEEASGLKSLPWPWSLAGRGQANFSQRQASLMEARMPPKKFGGKNTYRIWGIWVTERMV